MREVRIHLSCLFYFSFFTSVNETCIGGDVFVLHPDSSTASGSSRRRSFQPARRSLAHERSPRLTRTYADEENGVSTCEASSPLLVVDSPAVSRQDTFTQDGSTPKGTDDDIFLADVAVQGSGSAADPPSVPVRVVYSPAVARNAGDCEQMLAPSDFSPSSPLAEAPSPSQNQFYRRRGSTVSNDQARLPTLSVPSPLLRQQSNNRSPSERHLQEESDEADLSAPIFMAFPKWRGLRKVVVAKIALGIVTCCVLGNLIYT
jgi:hypothetical protein